MLRKLAVAATIVLALTAMPAGAGPVTYHEGGVATDIPGLAGFSTLGDMMDGMQVTACFSVISCETRSWADLGPGGGGVFGTGWGLGVGTDTFNVDAWFMFIDPNVAGQIVSLLLDGRGAFVIFDRTFGNVEGTVGSAAGRDWDSSSALVGAVDVTYLDPTGVGGNAPVGDLFQQVLIEFGQGGPRTSFSFSQDTDNDQRLVVPEPATALLIGAAALAFGLARRQRG